MQVVHIKDFLHVIMMRFCLESISHIFPQRDYFEVFFNIFLNVGFCFVCLLVSIFFSLAVFGYTPLITWKEFQSCMPWEIAILVGGGFALADGCEVM